MKEFNIFEATALTSPNPLTLICSENEDGTTNLAPICFVSYLSFNPPMIGFATGKQAHTGERVRETGKVIVTVPGETLSQAVMSCGSSTGSKVNPRLCPIIFPVPEQLYQNHSTQKDLLYFHLPKFFRYCRYGVCPPFSRISGIEKAGYLFRFPAWVCRWGPAGYG